MKKLISLAMALVMVFTLTVSALAAVQSNQSTTISAAGDQNVKLEGTVSNSSIPTVISVTMPTTIYFQVQTKQLPNASDLAAKTKTSSAASDLIQYSDANIFDNFYTVAADVINNSTANTINVSLVGLTDTNNLLDHMEVGIKSSENTTGEYFDASENYATNSISLLTNLAANGGQGSIELMGEAAAAVNILGTDREIDIPHATYELTTVLKVELAS